jgi:hypothetical protein
VRHLLALLRLPRCEVSTPYRDVFSFRLTSNIISPGFNMILAIGLLGCSQRLPEIPSLWCTRPGPPVASSCSQTLLLASCHDGKTLEDAPAYNGCKRVK